MPDCVRSGKDGGGRECLLLDVKVTPGASKSALIGVQEGRLRVKIAAAPEDGKANAELVSFLAKTLVLAKKDIGIVAGEKSRLKTLSLPPGAKDRLEAVLRTIR
jgi:uncharacterized protein (TIGR00251 family)